MGCFDAISSVILSLREQTIQIENPIVGEIINLGIEATTWIKMIQQLPISRSEQEVLRRFEQDPSGRQFLPLSDVLRNHKLLDESIELLTQGVQAHPGFSVARVVLARELFLRGLIMDAWTTLDRAPFHLSDNVLAQKLKYKMAILLGDEASANSALQYLNIQQGVDPEIKKISFEVQREGISIARISYRDELVARGVNLQMPQIDIKNITEGRISFDAAEINSPVRPNRYILEFELNDELRKQANQFHVVSLSDVFQPGKNDVGGSVAGTSAPVELDSTTLADIYAKQGFYAKALAIYERILKMAPHNDMIRLKVGELSRLNKNQLTSDMEVDPVAFERIEVVEIIERQSRFLNELLERLDRR